MSETEFSVAQFFKDGTYRYVCRWITAEEAVTIAKEYVIDIAARDVTQRVIITDGGDCTCFEWINGLGITFPPRESQS